MALVRSLPNRDSTKIQENRVNHGIVSVLLVNDLCRTVCSSMAVVAGMCTYTMVKVGQYLLLQFAFWAQQIVCRMEAAGL